MATAFPTMRCSADQRTLGFITSFYLGVWMLWVEAPIPRAASVVVLCWLPFVAMIAAVINHNVLHTPIFKEKWANRLVQLALTLIYGMPVSLFIPVHNHSHHKNMQTDRDVTRTVKLRSRYNLVNFVRAASRIGPDSLRDDLAYFRVQYQQGSTGVMWDALTEFLFLVVAGGMLLWADWRKFLLLFFLPWQMSQTFIVGINYVQHDGCDTDAKGYNYARNFTGTVFNWFFLNNGFHTAHHIKPGMHWSEARAAHEKLVVPHIHPNLDIADGWRFCWRYFVFPGTRETWDGKPYEPPALRPDQPWLYSSTETSS